MKLIRILLFILLNPLFLSKALAQCYVDVSEYNRWLCNNVRGAERACYDSPRKGNFATYEQCESTRKNALPYDFRWQRMTRCVCEGDSERTSKPKAPSYQQPTEDDINNPEIQKILNEKIIETQKKAEEERKIYEKQLQEEKIKEDLRFREEIKKIAKNIKTSPPPMTQAQKEQYRKALEQAYCVAYNSVKAAKLALEGKFEISKNLQTDIENLRTTAGYGFDTQVPSCPKDLKFNIPEVRASIEKDPQYLLLTQITSKMQVLIPHIEETYKNIQALQEKKKEIDKKITEIKEEIKKTKSPKIKKELKKEEDDLTKEAKELLSQIQERSNKVENLEEEVKKAKMELEKYKVGG